MIGALLFRPEASLLYFNVEHVRDAVWERIRSSAAAPRVIICDLSASPAVDLAGVRMLATLHTQLQAAGIRLRLVGPHAKVRDILRAEGMEERVGDFDRLAGRYNMSGFWSNGNFNYDNLVGLDDFNLLAGNFGLATRSRPRLLDSLLS